MRSQSSENLVQCSYYQYINIRRLLIVLEEVRQLRNKTKNHPSSGFESRGVTLWHSSG